ncbi:hypothetical protein V8F20_009501 [Naviculisporaceae sp. PSN 640]
MAKGRSSRSRSTSPSQNDKPKDKSSTQTKSSLFASDSSPELLHQLGRAVLSYGMKRLSGQVKSSSSKPQSNKSTTRSKSRDDRDGDPRSTSDSDSNDLHHIFGQVAMGLFSYGVRQYLHHRKLTKQKAAIARPPRRRPGDGSAGSKQDTQGQRTKGFGTYGTSGTDDRGADPELAAALESITAELEGTSKAIRKLAGRSPTHECDLHERLKDEAKGIQAGIERVQTSVNNVRNLHGGLRDAGDTAGVAIPADGDGVAAAGDVDNERKKTRRRRGLPREGSDTGPRSRDRGIDDRRYRGSRRPRNEDGERKRRRPEGGGYRHTSRLYSTRDRDREERRR